MAWNRSASRRHTDHHVPTAPAHAPQLYEATDPTLPDDLWLALNREIDRCRRYRHPLALVRVAGHGSGRPAPAPTRPRRDARAGTRRRDRRVDFAQDLRGVLRSGDTAWRHGAAVYVLAPETDAAGAEALVVRIRPIAVRVLGAPADIRIAAFPEHGVTGHALRRALEARESRFAASRAGGRRAATARTVLPRLADAAPAPDLRERAD